jgi:hypothetical protein
VRVTGAGARTRNVGPGAIENTGRIEILAGATFQVGAFTGSVLSNRPGGVVRVETGGTVSVLDRFENVGGQVDLTGGGILQTLGGFGRFVQGASADAVPVQSTVIVRAPGSVRRTPRAVKG